MTQAPVPITWISKGRENCTGNALTVPEPGGMLRTTCSKCSLNYVTPAAPARSEVEQ